MPAPSNVLLTLRPDLAESFEAFDLAMSWQGFIGQKILPVIEVEKASGNFGTIPLEQLLQTRDTKRSPGGKYNRAETTFTANTYATKQNGFEEPLDDTEAEMYASYFSAEQYASLRARDAVLRNYESRVVAAVTNTSVIPTGTVGTSWKTIASSDPVADIIAARKAVRDATGLIANAVVLGWDAYNNVKQSVSVINRIKYWGGSDPTTKGIDTSTLAKLFDVEEVIVAGAQSNTANQGQTASLSQIWSNDDVLVTRIAKSGDFKEPCIGRTFHWSGGGSSIDGVVEMYRDESVSSNIYRVRQQTDEKIIYSNAGYVLTGANA